jgi:hypothetical protein
MTASSRSASAPSPGLKRSRPSAVYARGRHSTTLTPGQQRVLRGVLGNLFCDNVCKRILQELRNRLRLARFDVAASEREAALVLAFLKDVWVKNKLPALSASVHWAMFRDGNTAVGINWVDGRPIITRERWWNGKTGVFVAYDDSDQVSYAVKEWNDGDGLRRTVYFDDRIERYKQSGERGWQMFRLPGDPPGDGPVPWRDRQNRGLGVPVVHFANLQVPNDGDGDEGCEDTDPRYGMSELDGGQLGLQDEVNDLHRDITAGARYAGYQMMYGTGVKTRRDDEGNEVPLVPEPGAMFTDENPDAKFGVLAAGSIEELERALKIKHTAMSRMAAVPLHAIAGDWPSGEALLRAEMPLIDKVETVGDSVGPAWASVAHKCVRLSNAFGSTTLNEAALITTHFAPVARRDPLTLAGVADKLSKHVGRTETLRILGYSPEDITRILEDVAANPPAVDDEEDDDE